ncbi:efflux RND transporter permease subunit [Paenibacillus sp. GCM10012307]|uniref:Efflux RND transporter permease subunit n=1 Tax=Paenibacillus roseus TaxID=2798579 RepID=A0A934J377_9BACL|nr:efflux RND transporter permease subunit [Paenibacillus roseus]MBJ6360648.1 efflux RND transporter permease subunit [Paenibacillus roseus]
MNGLIRFSMRRVAAMIIMIALLFGVGMFSGSSLKMEMMPNIKAPYVSITTTYAASPQDVMNDITKPIEERINNMQGIETITSTSSDNISNILVKLKDSEDEEEKKREIESLLSDLNLPDSASKPKAATFGFSSIPSYYTALNAKDMSQLELDKLYKDVIKPGFESINGIDHIDSIGQRETKLDIRLDVDVLNSYGLTPSEVSQAIRAGLAGGAIGTVEFNGQTQMARITGDMKSLYNFKNMEIMNSSGQTVLLGEVAEITAITDSEYISRMDGQVAIGINLYKTGDANVVDFSAQATKLINQWQEQYPGISFKKVYDSADDVKSSLSGLLREGIIGMVLAAAMILFFLRNVRMTLIVLVSIPLSILLTLILMHAFNITLNIMTLGGMFIAVGRIVDDSIVVIENVYSNLEKAQERNESVVLMATKQVAMAITSSTLVTAAVFLPIGLVSGVIGQLFRPFAITVSCALLASLLVALTVIPMLSKLLVLKNVGKGGHTEHTDGKLNSIYKKILLWSLTHRVKTIVFSIVFFLVSIIGTVPFLPLTFMPEGEGSKQVSFNIKLPYETSLESTDLQVQQIEKLLQEAKDPNGDELFTFYQSLVGYDGTNNRVPYFAQIIAEVNGNATGEEVRKEYVKKINLMLPKGSELKEDSLGGGDGFGTTDFSYALQGDDQELLERGAQLVMDKLKDFPELTGVNSTMGDAKKEVNIAVSHTKAQQFGLSAAQIQSAVRAWIWKENLGDLRFDNVLYRTTLQLAEHHKNSLEQLGKIPIQSPTGQTVYLNEVADIKEVQARVALNRENLKQHIKITANIKADNKAAVSVQVGAELAKLQLPEGVNTQVSGVTDDIMKSFTEMFVAMGIAIGIVYLIMVLAFGNASTPFAILFSLPLAVIGGLIGLLITSETLNVTTLIGFMMLIGIVITNAIVLLDRAQQLLHEGMTVRNAIVEAGMVRLRPIIMTAGATIAAMLPLAIGLFHSESGGASLVSKGLAIVVIGGLTSSTLLTLVVVPVIYETLELWKTKLSNWSSRDRKSVDKAKVDV